MNNSKYPKKLEECLVERKISKSNLKIDMKYTNLDFKQKHD